MRWTSVRSKTRCSHNPSVAGVLKISDRGMVAAGECLLQQTGTVVPSTVHSSLMRACKVGNSAPVVLENVHSSQADLVAVGSRERDGSQN
ncbi:MAG: hypothetical protein OJF47_001083 [Nitrospira sp.]|jgi:hypothetical protein|nr:MAG: hypothetical protein OJF47_001083 [Nitrospira sp.]